MRKTRPLSSTIGQAADTPAKTEAPEPGDGITAWKPVEGDLWIPLRIRGSYRGQALG